jgi:putative membrane protein insertion efficiency factor
MKLAERIVLAALGAYRRFVSPYLPPACRFVPSCSEYALQAIQRHGIVRGGRMAIRRVASCHPFHPGGFDPIR